MKTVIIISSCSFPLSAVAGGILTGKLPDHYTAERLWEIFPSSVNKKYSEGQMCWLGNTPDGSRVAAFTARSGGVILKNLIASFLEIHNIERERCSVVEIDTPHSLGFLLGQMILELPLVGRAGRRMVEKYIEKIYPELVKSVKLDCNCQISDN